MVLSGPAAADWLGRAVTERDDTREREEIHDGDRATQCPDQGFKVKSAGMSMPITETVLDYQPEKLQLLQMEGMLSGRARWELTPEGDGTRLTTTFDYALPGGVLGKLADALIVKRMNGKSLEQGLNNFKALVERQ